MKTTLTCALASATMLTSAYAQSSGLVSHWDFSGSGFTASLAPEDNGISCITPSNITKNGLGHSYSTIDSETGVSSHANCFGQWDPGDFVNFKLTYADTAVGELTSFNLDVGNYGNFNGQIDPTAFRVEAFKNGASVGFLSNANSDANGFVGITNGISSNPWTSTSDQTFSLAGLGLNSADGSTDMFEFRIFTNGGTGRIALDHIRVNGIYDCVPEPSSAALGLLGLIGFAARRRR